MKVMNIEDFCAYGKLCFGCLTICSELIIIVCSSNDVCSEV